MRSTLQQVVCLAGMLVASVLAPAARAQAPGRGSVYYPRQAFVPVPTFTTIRVQTTVTVPDGGSVTVGGYSQQSEGRSAYGAPVLGRTPYVGRGFGNVGYGRRTVRGRVSVRVRIISLREEEFRQTGFRSP